MEILIPGLALVALMVYVSTRIKRSAAKAYDEEIVETDEFTIIKPAGFIIPTDTNDLAFAAYSKEFGPGETDSIRQVSAEVRVDGDASVEGIRETIVSEATKVESEQHLAGGSMMLETKIDKNGFVLDADHRLIQKNGKVFVLAVTALPETRHEQEQNIDKLLASFEVK